MKNRSLTLLVVVGAVALAAAITWLAANRGAVAEHDRAPSPAPPGVALSAVPGHGDRKFPTELGSKLDLLDPAKDGWDSEVSSEAIHEQLQHLADALEAGELSAETAAALVAERFSCTPLRPPDLETAFQDKTFTIERQTGAAAAGRHAGAAGFTSAVSRLLEPYSRDEALRAKLELNHIAPEGADVITTVVDFQLTGPAPGGRLQQNAIWEVAWIRPAAGSAPLLTSLVVREYEESRGPADGAPLFEDVTAAVLGDDPIFAAQLVLGRTHWASMLDVVFGEQIMGDQGLAVGDVNGDGLDDVYLAQGGGLPNRLLVQRPDGTVADIAAEAGVDYLDLTTAALILDFDNDGDQDLVTAAGALAFHSNDGRGHFQVETIVPTSTVYSLAAADYDNDRDLDLYACKSGSPELEPPTPYHDANHGPPNLMLRNDGQWRFTDVTRESGLGENNRRYSFAAAWANYDGDGDDDLFVANDFGRDNLYRNDGGHFRDVAPQAGVDDISAGRSAAWGDYDGDGRLDLYVGNLGSAAGLRTTDQPQFKGGAAGAMLPLYKRHVRGNTLFKNTGDGSFEDVSLATGVTLGRWAGSSKFADVNNDGREDLFVANGNVTNDDPHDLGSFFWRQVVAQSPNEAGRPSKSYVDGWSAIYELVRQGHSWSGRERKVCYLNTGTTRFADVSAVSGLDVDDDGRGLGVVDWDHDGALDFWLSSRSGPQVRVLHNRNVSGHHFAAFRLEGRSSNRDAIGARVELHRASGPPLVQTLSAGDGYLSQSSKTIHFGLGPSNEVVRVIVRWPGGASEEFSGIAADRHYRLVQGTGRAEGWSPPRREPLPAARALPPPPSGTVRTFLAARLPLHGLRFEQETGGAAAISSDAEHPLVVVLWASWCEHCRKALTELEAASGRLQRVGLRVLALSVDAPEDRLHAREFLSSIDWSFDHGDAGEELLDVIGILRQAVVDLPGTMVLPTSLLIDVRNELAAIYRGPLDLATLLGDVAALEAGREEHLARAVPFAGRWLVSPPAVRNTKHVANLLGSRGHSEIAAAYLNDSKLPDSRAEALESRGRSLAAEGKHQAAVEAYDQGLAIDLMRASLHQAMGASLLALKRLDGAIRHFEHAARIEPRNPGAHFDLGTVYGQRGRLEDAERELSVAIELSHKGEEAHYAALFNLGMILDLRQQPEAALELVRQSLQERPDYFDALRFLGHFHLQRHQLVEAIDYLERSLEQRPKDPRALYLLALAQLEHGDPEEARRQQQLLAEVDAVSAAQLLRQIESGTSR